MATLTRWSLAGLGFGLALACKAESPPAEVAAAPVSAPSQVVAEIQGEPLTLEQVDARVRVDEPDAIQAIFDARARAIDGIAEERLVGAAAKARDMTPEALIEAEVTAKVEPISEEAMREFYEQNAKSIPGETFESLRPRIQEYLEAIEQSSRRRAFITKLKKESGFTMLLEPPRQELRVAQTERVRGPMQAPITIVEYADFQCPFCSRVGPTMDRIAETYGDKVKIVYRDFPLGNHAQARGAAEAGLCAHAQGKFWEFHDAAFENQADLGPEVLQGMATKLGLDAAKYASCVENREFEQAVKDQEARADKLGVTATPTFFVNGRMIAGAQPYDRFAELIDDELSRR